MIAIVVELGARRTARTDRSLQNNKRPKDGAQVTPRHAVRFEIVPEKGRLDYDLVGIADVLSRHEYRVPTYQRSYAWDEPEIIDFWDDLRQALDAEAPDYFLGTLVLTPHQDQRRITIIDGQQRLATTSLILAALRRVWLKREEPDQADDIFNQYLSVFDRRARMREPRLMLNDEDDQFFRELVVEGKSPTPERESHERLGEALVSFEQKLNDDANAHGRKAADRLIRWTEFLDTQATAITVTVPTEADAFVIFETLNDRGAPLTIGDLLKNYLFMRAGNRLDAVRTAWIQALNELDISAENDVFVTFLRHHWSSMHGAVRERDLYSGIKEEIQSANQAVRYAEQLAKSAKLYAALLSPSDDYWTGRSYGTSVKNNVATLLTLELEQNRPLLLAVMEEFSNRELKRTLKALVSWSIRGIIVGGIGGGRTERAYCEAAVAVRAKKIKTTEQLLKRLSPIIPEDDDFKDAFSRARQTKSAIARYLLLALERSKAGEKEPELVPNANEEEVNLEHILPQRAKRTDWPQFREEEVATWSQRLGNQCLLKKTENAKIGNKPWRVKKPILTSSSLKLTKAAGQVDDWNIDAIKKRQRRMAKDAPMTWPRKATG